MLTHNTNKNNIKFFYCYSNQMRELQMKRKMISVLLALVMLTLATGVFAKQDKVTICHKPGTAAEETLSVAAPALKAHLGHGDSEGECSFTETDTEPPTVTVPADITQGITAGETNVIIYYDASASDNVGVISFSCTPPSGSSFPLGTTSVICTASDAALNSTTASFNVTIVESS
jgi:hypothetical protein